MVSPSHWGSGCAGEACRRIIADIFDATEAAAVVARAIDRQQGLGGCPPQGRTAVAVGGACRDPDKILVSSRRRSGVLSVSNSRASGTRPRRRINWDKRLPANVDVATGLSETQSRTA